MATHGLSGFQRGALLIGAGVSLGVVAALFPLRIPLSEWPAASLPALLAGVMLWTPYVGPAFIAEDSRHFVRYGFLALLAASSLLVWWSASSDPQGGIVALYAIPVQWLIAILAALPPLHRPLPESTAPPGS